MSTWIVVADAARARVFEVDQLPGAWRLRCELAHPESREKNVDLTPTEPGHAMKSKGDAHHSSFQARAEPHEIEAQRFAREIVELLSQGEGARELDKLVLVAPPHFLGELRGLLSTKVAARLLATVDHDYTQLDEAALQQRLLDKV